MVGEVESQGPRPGGGQGFGQHSKKVLKDEAGNFLPESSGHSEQQEGLLGGDILVGGNVEGEL